MNDKNQHNVPLSERSSSWFHSEEINFRPFLLKLFVHWKLFVATFLVLMVVSAVSYKVLPKFYELSTTILINEEIQNKSTLEAFMKGLEFFNLQVDVNNEQVVLSSYSLLNEALLSLPMEIKYFKKKLLDEDLELYKTSPFELIKAKNVFYPVDVPFKIKILDDNSFELKVKGHDLSFFSYDLQKGKETEQGINFKGTFKFNQEIKHEMFRFTLQKTEFADSTELLPGDKYVVVFNDLNELTHSYLKKMDVEISDPDAAVCKLSLPGTNKEKIADILNTVASFYIQKTIRERSLVASKTIAYIDEQLVEISLNMQNAEENLQRFKKQSKILNLDAKQTKLQDQMSALKLQKEEAKMTVDYFEKYQAGLNDEDEQKTFLIPSWTGVQDQILDNLVTEITNLIQERNNLARVTSEDSRRVKQLDARISDVKILISNKIASLIKSKESEIEDLSARIEDLNLQVTRMPVSEREFLRLEREVAFFKELYAHLLEKKSEAQLALNAEIPDGKIIDPAISKGVKPSIPLLPVFIFLSLVFTILIPVSWIIIRFYFGDLISGKKDAEKLLGVPVLSTIRHSKKAKAKHLKNPDPALIKDIYTISLNMQVTGEGKNSILITSACKKDGKWMTGYYLASLLASQGIKTVFVNADFDNHASSRFLETANKPGLKEYFNNNMDNIEQIVDQVTENFYYVAPGQSKEALYIQNTEQKFNDLLKTLHETFDRVIITAGTLDASFLPVMLVNKTGKSMFLLRQFHSVRRKAYEGYQQLKELKSDPLHVVLTDARN